MSKFQFNIHTFSITSVEFSKVKDLNGNARALYPAEMAQGLFENSDLKYSFFYPKIQAYYWYWEGSYIILSEGEMKTIMYQIFRLFKSKLKSPQSDYGTLYLSSSFITAFLAQFRIGANSNVGLPSPSNEWVAFQNNVILNLKTRETMAYNPDIFITTRYNFDYNPDATCPKFEAFLEDFCCGYEDRKIFTLSWLKCVLFGITNYQVFIMLVGPGASGKSQMAKIAEAFAGHGKVVSTSLKGLNSDRFEIANVREKNLILISDSELYTGKLEILKQITGGDLLNARLKGIQGSFDFYANGIVLIVSNHNLGSYDASNAISRRMRSFKAEHISNKREDLIHFKDDIYQGAIGAELPGILNKLLDFDVVNVEKYVYNMEDYVLSLSEHIKEARLSINYIAEFIEECIIIADNPKDGAYLGAKPTKSLDLTDTSQQECIYPTFLQWCGRRGIKSTMDSAVFASNLISSLLNKGFTNILKVRHNKGMFIKGVLINAEFWSAGVQYPNLELPKDNDGNEVKTPLLHTVYKQPAAGDQHIALIPNLYEEYKSLASQSKILNDINLYIINSLDEKLMVNDLYPIFVMDLKDPSDGYLAELMQRLDRFASYVKKSGAFPDKYRSLGQSPRITPNNTRHLTSVSSKVRNYVYNYIVNSPYGDNYKLVQFDLRSCFTHILLGLYPNATNHLLKVLDKGSIWAHIEEQFKLANKHDLYDKGCAKVSLYAPLFGGTSKAMEKSVVEFLRTSAGITQKEFSGTEFEMSAKSLANDFTSVMNNIEVVKTFPRLARNFKNANRGKTLIGPTGFPCAISDTLFGSNFAYYLQSFEFALIANSTLKLIKQHPGICLAGHFHDGVTLLIPKDLNLEELLKDYNSYLKELGDGLGLQYTQSIEVYMIHEKNIVDNQTKKNPKPKRSRQKPT